MKIICIGRNYSDHAKELNNPVPKEPLIFIKPSTALLTDNKPFYHPDFSQEIHYELEVVLRVKKTGKVIQPQFASSYYDQIGLGIDFTARDLQDQCKSKGHPWEIAKAFDNSAAVSEFVDLKTFNPLSVHFQLFQNGNVVQSGDTADMIFSFDYLISYISTYFTLQQGDYIFTGTPSGVGKINIGDKLEGFLEGNKLLECKIK
ncbi:MAG: fumarylacetoacetate hydrolase family protein [Saprospiraceae bacterium]|nr:fumarylacetoacetate hydrolase family protein [Saprospiraceae bacterium]